jgi:hypothetical protein
MLQAQPKCYTLVVNLCAIGRYSAATKPATHGDYMSHNSAEQRTQIGLSQDEVLEGTHKTPASKP